MYDKYLDKFMQSKDMREYLKSLDDIDFFRIADIICYSVFPIEEKLSALKELYNEIPEEAKNDEWNTHYISKLEDLIYSIEFALERTKRPDGIYTLENCEYDTYLKDSTDYLDCLFSSFEEAFDKAKDYTKWNKEDNMDMFWFEITRWEKDESGKMIEICKYYIIDSEIVYIDIRNFNDDIQDHNPEEMIGFVCLYLPVPFAPGDIVEIDGRPFGPVFHAAIIDIGDNRDCCCVQGLARDREGLWHMGAVKHEMIGTHPFPQKPMLLTITRYDEELLAEDEKVLLRVRDHLKENKERKNVEDFMDKIWFNHEDLTDERLIELIESPPRIHH